MTSGATMLAARAYEGENRLRLEQVAIPAIGKDEVLVRVAASGVQVGMLTLWQMGWIKLLPATLGHQMAGTVAEVGEDAGDWNTGDRVRIHPNLSCRSCPSCLAGEDHLCDQAATIALAVFEEAGLTRYARYKDGGLATYVRAPGWLLDRLPERVSFEVGAKVHDAAIALSALRAARVEPGATVVVTAPTGAMGAITVRLAASMGVARVIAVGRSRDRLEDIRELAPGLIETVAVEELGDDWDKSNALAKAIRTLAPRGPDAIIDYTPAGPLTWAAIGALRVGGSAVIMGGNPDPVPLPTVAILANCWRISGLRNGSRRAAMDVMALLATDQLQLEDLITHRFPLSDVNSALELMETRRERTWLISVEISDDVSERASENTP
jgi:threonine dehydrogenase-like Zn-dependent dehydrogenase